jgi:serine/threonine protein kinase
MSAAPQPKICPECSCRLEKDGVCLVCLLNEGMEAEDEPLDGVEKSSRTLVLPCVFAGHRLVREIASGGMGIVYEAEDVKLKRVVAMKVVRNAHFATQEEAARFRAEAQAVGMLDHPAIVPIYESGEEDGVPYYTMRLAEGGSLGDRLKKQGVMPEREAAAFMSTIARAVQHAHDHGVLHRDLKPANILMDVGGGPMLSDFGLAKLLHLELHMTHSQAHMGTPYYMSPEQVAGNAKQITTASDVWALGVMLYQMITDRLPFQGVNAMEVMRRITEEEPEISSVGRLTVRLGSKSGDATANCASSVAMRRVQPDIATLILRCLEKQPARRLSSAGLLADELDRFLKGEPIQSRAVGSFERLKKFAWRNKAATLGILATSAALIAGTCISLWQAVKARQAEQQALQQKADSDEIAAILMTAARPTNERFAGEPPDSDQMRNDLLKRVKGFAGDPQRKAELLMDVSDMLRKPSDIKVYRQVLADLETELKEDDPLLWSLRYHVELKRMHASEAGSEESRAAREALRQILAWQTAHLDEADTQIYHTKFALAVELQGEVGTPAALQEAEELFRSCKAHYERQKNASDLILCRIEWMTTISEQGRQEEALKIGRETCEYAMQERGLRHVVTGRAYGRLAKHCREAGLIDEAISHSRLSLDIYWHTVGPGYSKADSTTDALVGMLKKKGDMEGVLQLRRASLGVFDQRMGVMSPETQWEAGNVVDVLRDMSRLEEAHALAEMWMDRVRVDGHLPPGAASLLVYDFLNLRDMGRQEEAEKLMRQLPELLKAEKWSESAYYVLRRWKAVAWRLNNADRHSECINIAKHIIEILDKGSISGRKANGTRPEFQKLLEEALAEQKKTSSGTVIKAG